MPEIPEATPEITPEAAPQNVQSPAQEQTDWETKYQELKAESRKWEDRSKANLAELEAERQKTQAYEAEKKLAQLISEVSKTKGVPADLLRGGTREELETHADALAPLLQQRGPYIPGQEQAPSKVEDDPERTAVRELFGTT